MEREIPEGLEEHLQPKEEVEEPVEIGRAEFKGRCLTALDILRTQNQELIDQNNDIIKGINSITGMLDRAELLEEDQDFEAVYLEMPGGSVAVLGVKVEKDDLGFRTRDKDGL